MKLFLVRHAEAELEFPEGLGDESRCLQPQARNSIGEHFASLRREFGNIQRVDSSPYMRCVQTAQILTMTLAYTGPLCANTFLLPDRPVTDIRRLLKGATFESRVLVGHNPNIGAFAAHLLGLTSLNTPVIPGTVIALESQGESVEKPFHFLFVSTPP